MSSVGCFRNVGAALTALGRLEVLRDAGRTFSSAVEGRYMQAVDAVGQQVGQFPAGFVWVEDLSPLFAVMRVVSV